MSGRQLARHRIRRDARRMRRYGVEPMMMIDQNTPFAPLAVVVLGSWVWRYRSELAPLVAALAVECTAVALHIIHREWRTAVILVTIAGALAVTVGGRLIGLRGIERAYAAVTITATGGWIAAATALGPGRPPLPALLIIGA